MSALEGSVIVSEERTVHIQTLKHRSCHCEAAADIIGLPFFLLPMWYFIIPSPVWLESKNSRPLSLSEGPVLYRREEFNDLSQRQHPPSVERLDLK